MEYFAIVTDKCYALEACGEGNERVLRESVICRH